MSKHLKFNNKIYFSSPEAGKTAGYTSDYVAKLCREGNLTCERIGRSWFVEESSLKEFVIAREHERVARHQQLSEQRKSEYYEQEIESADTPSASGHSKLTQNSKLVIQNSRAMVSSTLHAQEYAYFDPYTYTFAQAPITGTYFRKVLAEQEDQRRAARALIPYTPIVPVDTFREFGQKTVALLTAFMIVFGSTAVSGEQYLAAPAHIAQAFDRGVLVASELPQTLASADEAVEAAFAALGTYVVNPRFPEIHHNALAQVNALEWLQESYDSVLAFFRGTGTRLVTNTTGFIGSGNARGVVDIQIRGVQQIDASVADASTSDASPTRLVYTPATTTTTPERTTVVNNSPVIERIIQTERVVMQSGVTLEQLQQTENELRKEIVRLSADNATDIGDNFHSIALTQRIDTLGGVLISNSRIVSSSVEATSLTVANDASFNADVTIAGALTVTGTSTFSSLVAHDFTYTGTLTTPLSAGITHINGSGALSSATGTANTIVKFNTAGTALADSIIIDDGAVVSVVGSLAVSGTSTLATTTITTATIADATVTDLTATNSVLTNATATNLFAVDLAATDATFTNATSTNFFSNLLTAITGAFTNFTATNATTTNLIATNATSTNFVSSDITTGTLTATGSTTLATTTITNAAITDATITDASVTRLLATYATTTTLFGANATFTNATSTNFFSNALTAITGIFTNLTATNATLTNATTTNLVATDTTSGTLAVSGTSTLATTTITTATIADATVTDLIATNATTTNLVATDATTSNLTATGVTTLATTTITDATITDASVTRLLATYATTTTLFGANATFTDAVFTNATSTNFFTNALTAITGAFTNFTATNATTTNLVATDATLTNATSTNFFTNALTAITGIFTNLTATNATLTNATTTNLIVTGDTALGTTTIGAVSVDSIDATDATFTNATSTNFFTNVLTAITGAFTNLTATNATTTNLVVTGSANLATTTINGILTVDGGAIVIGNTNTDTLTINSAINSDLVPDQNAVRNLGSPSYFWDEIYADNINVNSISAASSTIGGTASNTFTINTDNVTADTEDVNLVFYRGTVVPNAVIAWDSTLERFDINQPFFIQNNSSTTTVPTLQLVGKTGQTAPLLVADTSAGSRVLTVEHAGNVGIGTATPSAKLHILGTTEQLRLAYGVSSYWTDTVASDGGRTIAGFGTDADLNFDFSGATDGDFSVNTNQFFVDTSTGRVGVGTASPSYALDVTGVINASSMYRIGTKSVVSQAGSDVVFGNSDNNIDNIRFANGTTEKMRITSSGNVGIGTTTPASKLSVAGDLLVTATSTLANTIVSNLTISNLTSTRVPFVTTGGELTDSSALTYTGGVLYATGNVRGGNLITNGLLQFLNSTRVTAPADGQLLFRHLAQDNFTRANFGGTTSAFPALASINTSTGSQTALQVIAADGSSAANLLVTGNVGIGTTTPASKLTVIGDGYFAGNLTATGTVAANTVSTAMIKDTSSVSALDVTNRRLLDSGTINALDFSSASNLKLSQYTTNGFLKTSGGNGTVVVDTSISTSGGNVGIGTTTPASKLSVSGGASIGANYATAAPTNGLIVEGNVGIGTTSPGVALQIKDRWQIDSGYIQSTNSSGAYLAYTGGITTPILSFAGDTDTGISRGGSNILNFITGGSERMRIDTVGNVGIGTTTPASKLTVIGDGYFAGNLTATGTLTTTGAISAPYFTATDAAATSTFAGRVGIGTTVPGSKLHIREGSSGVGAVTNAQLILEATGSRFIQFALPTASTGGIYFGDTSNSARGGITYQNSTAAGLPDTMTFITNGNARMVIDDIGNIGIGTTSPSTPLEIRNDTAILTLDDTSGIYGGAIRFKNSGITRWTLGGGLDGVNVDSFGIANTSGTPQFSITQTGNVGIGDTTPAYILTVGNGDLFGVNSSGAIAAATGITSSGTITFSGLTANRLVATNGSSNLVSTITADNLRASVSSTTGTGNLVFADTPTLSNVTLSGITALSDFTATNATITNATSTNFYSNLVTAITGIFTNLTATNATFTNATSTNLVVTGDVSLGTTTIGAASVTSITATDATFTNATSTNFFTNVLTAITGAFTNLTATNATTTNLVVTGGANLATTTISGVLTVDGDAVVIGNTNTDTLTINSAINSDLIPDQNAVRNLGSPAYYWDEIYANNINVNSISAASTTIGGTANNTFTINTDNMTADTEDMSLVFFRGTVVPNAVIHWDSTRERFDINQPFFIQNNSSTTTVPTLQLVGKTGQTAPLLVADTSAGSRVLTVEHAGNVGIGTATPSAKLHILGTTEQLRLAYGVSSYWTDTVASDGGRTIAGFGTDADLNFDFSGATDGDFSVNTNDLFVDTSTGRVGVGTASPGAALEVQTTDATAYNPSSVLKSGISIFNANDSAAAATLFFRSRVSGGAEAFVAGVFESSNLGGLALGVETGANTYEEALRISSSKYVGIGNSSPTSLLHLGTTFDNDAATPTLSFGDGDTGFYESADDQLRLSLGGTNYFTFLSTRLVAQNGAAVSNSASSTTTPVFIPTTGALTAGLGGSGGSLSLITDGASRIFVTSSGNVGIGTTNPAYKLDVTGGVRITSGILLTGDLEFSSSGAVKAQSGSASAPSYSFSADTNTGMFRAGDDLLAFSTAGSERLRINASGNVGIGTTNPGVSAAKTFNRVVDIGSEIDNSIVGLNLKIMEGVNGRRAAFFLDDATGVYGFNATASTGVPSFVIESAGTERLRVTDSGNVGIGDTSPAALLTVGNGDLFQVNSSGAIAAATGITSSGAINFSGTLSVTGTSTLATTTATALTASNGLTVSSGGAIITGNSTIAGTLSSLTGITSSGTITFSGLTGGLLRTNGSGVLSTTTITGADVTANSLDFSEFKDALTLDATTTIAMSYPLNFDSNTLYIDPTTNRVGVGTASPEGRLHVFQGSSGQSVSGLGLILETNGSSVGTNLFQAIGSLGALFEVRNSGDVLIRQATAGLTIGASTVPPDGGLIVTGNVGIGTTMPQSLLDVYGPGVVPSYTAGTKVASHLRILSATSTQGTGPRISLGTIYSGSATIESGFIAIERRLGSSSSGSAGSADMVFGINVAGSPNTTEIMRLDGDVGNVGIGTTNPGANLDVSNTAGGVLRLSRVLDSSSWTVGDQAGSLDFYNNDATGVGAGVRGYVKSVTESTAGNLWSLAFGTSFNNAAATEAMRINSSGNVGIGTTSPAAKLDVYGTLFANSGVTKLLNESGVGTFRTTSTMRLATDANSMVFDTAGSERMRITNSGNVGIGTTTPASKLSVSGGASIGANYGVAAPTNGLIVEGNVGIGTATPGSSRIYVNQTGADSIIATLQGDSAGTNQTNLVIEAADTGATGLAAKNILFRGESGASDFAFAPASGLAAIPSLVLKASGNVGIGDTTPAYMLTVGNGDLFGVNSSGAIAAATGITSSGAINFSGTLAVTGTSTLATTTATQLTTTGNTYLATSGGNVGVGTASPGTKLDVLGTAGNTIVQFRATGGAGVSWYSSADYVQESFGGDTLITTTGTGNPLSLGTDATERIRITSTGNVGIGTTTPASKLTVIGDGYFAGNLTATGTLSVLGSISAPYFTATDAAATSTFAGGLSVGTTAFNVLQNGNVGVGTASPGARLEVNGSIIPSSHLAVGTADLGAPSRYWGKFYGNAFEAYNGGTNTFYAQGGTLTVSTAGSPNFFIGTTGNVGIGTSTPSEKLQVFGNIISGGAATISNFASAAGITNFTAVLGDEDTDIPGLILANRGSTNNQRFQMYLDAPNSKIVFGNTLSTGQLSDYVFRAASSDLVTIKSSGNVGIGTTTPASRLSVSGGASIGANYATAAPTNGLIVEGNVGIGTASPQNKLHVDGKTIISNTNALSTTSLNRDFQLSLEDSANTDDFAVGISFRSSAVQNRTPGAAIIHQRTASDSFGKLHFLTRTGSDVNSPTAVAMTIDGSQNVGIGITSPAHKLDVSGSARITNGLLLTGDLEFSSSGAVKAQSGSASAPSYSFSADTNTGIFRAGTDLLAFSTAGVERARIDASGNVGIGDTSPLYKFTVGNGDLFGVNSSGAIAAATGITSSGTITFSGLTGGFLKTDGSGVVSTSTISGSDLALQNGYVFRGSSANVAEATSTLFIADSGNVGIGTTTVPAKLSIDTAGASNVGLSIRGFSAQSQPLQEWRSSDNTLAGRFRLNNTTGGLLELYQGGTVTAAIDGSNGRMWAGTSAALPGDAPGAGSSAALSIAPSSNRPGIVIRGASGQAAALTEWQNNSGTALSIVDASGSFGIGTTTPQGALTIHSGQVTIPAGLVGTPSIAFNNDLDTGIYSTGANTIDFSAGGSRAVTIESGGLAFNPTSAVIRSLQAGGSVTLRAGSAGSIILNDVTSSQVGFIGVKANTGTYTQTSGNTVAFQITPTYNQTTSTAANTDLYINRTETSVGSGAQYLFNAAVGGSSRFVITSTGNVGVGTTTPLGLMHLASGAPNLYISDNNSSQGTTIANITFRSDFAGLDNGRIGFAGDGNLSLVNQYASGSLTLGTNSIERLRITSTGNVGIGTTTPGSKLHITDDAGNAFRVSNITASSFASSQFQNDAGDGLNIINYGSTYAAGSLLSVGAGGTAIDVANDLGIDGGTSIRLGIAGSEKVRVDSSGNVGIGDTTPAYMLTVGNGDLFGVNSSGAIAAATGITSSGTITFSALTGGLLRTNGSGVLSTTTITGSDVTPNSLDFTEFKDALTLDATTTIAMSYPLNFDSNTLYIDPTNNRVGVGTASPTRSLDVYNNSSAMLANFRSASGDNSFISFSNNSSTADQVRLGSTAGNLVLSTNYTERFRIDSSGNVGIGTSSPAAKLAIQTTGTTDILNLFETGGEEVFTVLESGNVGIGTTNPQNKLHIQGAVQSSDVVLLNLQNKYSNAVTSASLRFSGGTNDTGWPLANIAGYVMNSTGGGNGALLLSTTLNGVLTEKMRIDNNGNVGIGTTTPAAKLQVNTGTSTTIGQIIKGAASQSANLTEWQNSAGMVVAAVNAAGNISINPGSTNVSNITLFNSTYGIGMDGGSLVIFSPVSQSIKFKDASPTGTQYGQIDYKGSIFNPVLSSATGDQNALAVNYTVNKVTSGNDRGLLINKTDTASPGSSWLIDAQTGGVSKFVVEDTGNVGIGTTTPASKLSVSGGASIGANYATAAPTNGLIVEGNVGIGTAGPGAKLEISTGATDVKGLKITGIAGGTVNLLEITDAQGSTSFRVDQNNTLFTESIQAYSQIVSGVGNHILGGWTGTGDSNASLTILPTATNKKGLVIRGLSSQTGNLVEWQDSGANVLGVINNTGNVGIGTTSPASKLDVWGDLRVGTSSTPTLFANTATGNVGVGTAVPTEKFQVVGGSMSVNGGNTTGQVLILNDSVGPYININRSGSSVATLGHAGGLISGGGGNFGIAAASGKGVVFGVGSTEVARIDSTGNVGIGDTSPLYALTVGNGDLFGVNSSGAIAAATGITSSGTITLSDLGTGFLRADAGVLSTTTINVASDITGTLPVANGGTGATSFGANRIPFMNAGNTALTSNTNFVFDGTNVGIGTASPVSPIEIVRTDASAMLGASSTALTLRNNETNNPVGSRGFSGINFAGVGTTDTGRYAAIAGTVTGSSGSGQIGALIFGTKPLVGDTALVERMRITSTGNVGIGTSTPASKLDVWGNFQVGTSSIPAFLVDTGTGRVGIGTQTPSGLLDVRGGSNAFPETSGTTQTGLTARFGRAQAVVDIGSNGGSGNWIQSTNATNLSLNYTLLLNPNGGDVGIGTTAPTKRLSVTETVADAQFIISYDATRYSTFQVDSTGDLIVATYGGDVRFNDENLWVCAGGSCPSGTPSGQGNMIVETAIGIGTSTPWTSLAVAVGGAITVEEKLLTTSGTIAVDWRNGNQQLIRLTTSAATINFSGYIAGQKLSLITCSPGGSTAGAITWGTTIRWTGGSAPTQTTTAGRCDVWSFLATSSNGTLRIFGAQTPNFTN